MIEPVDSDRYCIPPTFLDAVTHPRHRPAVAVWYQGWGPFCIFVLLVYILRLCMGQSASSIYKKTTNYIRGSDSPQLTNARPNSVVVRQRRSSLQRDEDNDVAHEFYEEIKHINGRSKMKKVHKTYPLGFVKLQVPCLHPDFVRIILPNYDLINKFQSTVDAERKKGEKDT